MLIEANTTGTLAVRKQPRELPGANYSRNTRPWLYPLCVCVCVCVKSGRHNSNQPFRDILINTFEAPCWGVLGSWSFVDWRWEVGHRRVIFARTEHKRNLGEMRKPAKSSTH